jgi:hypothetical protein
VKRTVTAMVAVFGILAGPAARLALAQPSPFPEVPMPAPARHSYTWAYASLIVGASMMGSSFAFSNRANHAYRDYLQAVEPEVIERLYDRAVRNDRLSSATLLGGEALIATGLYLRFLRNPPESRLSVAIGPTRCALSLRF